MKDSIKKKAVSGVRWSATSKIVLSLVAVLQVAILTRFLEKEDFGLMGIAVLVNMFCTIFADMGMSVVAMHELNLSRERFSSFYWFNVFIGFILFLLISACSPLIAYYYRRNELIGIISFTSLMIFINSLSSLQKTYQQKRMNFRFMSVVEIFSSIVVLFLNIYFAIKGLGVYSLVWSSLIGSCITAVSYIILAVLEKNIVLFFSWREIKGALTIGVYQVGTSTMDFFSREMDSFIISSNMSMELFGVYTLCKNLTSKIYSVINPIVTNVLTPILSTMQNDIRTLSQTYVRCVQIIGFVNFPIYSVVAIAASSILTLLYGSSYSEYYIIMAGLSIFFAFQSCGSPIGSLLIATGRTDRGFYWTIYRILFTTGYLYLASQFDLNVFVLLLMAVPVLTSYPHWHIILKHISTIDFKTSFMLPIKPLLICSILFPLTIINDIINIPLLSVILILLTFFAGYFVLNRIFRPQIQSSIIGLVYCALSKR